MANTHGFQLVTEVSVPFLRAFLRAAWKSGGKKLGEPLDPGTIPESLDLAPETSFGAFVLEDGQIQIPKDELDISLLAGVGADIKIGIRGQAHLKNAQNPAVPSLSLRDISAEIHVVAPIGELTGPEHGPHEIGIQLNAAPRPAVKLTGPDPAMQLRALVQEQLQSQNLAALAATLPPRKHVPFVYRGVLVYTATERLELLSDATHHMVVAEPPQVPPGLRISIPVKLTVSEPVVSTNPPPPMLEGFEVEATIVATAVLEVDPGLPGGHILHVNAPTTIITAEGIKPRGAIPAYTGNRLRFGPEFDSIVKDHVLGQGRRFFKQLGDLTLSVPTVASIENALAVMLQGQLATLAYITIWAPEQSAELPLTIEDVEVKVLGDALVLAINPGPDADYNALGNLLPIGRDLVVAISDKGVQNVFETQKRLSNPFHRYHGDDHDFDLHELGFSLKQGAIHLHGKMTVIDAIADTFDVDASFEVDVHLAWTPQHAIQATADEPDVDTKLSITALVISLILGFFTAGGLGVLIAMLIGKIVEMIAANIGAHIVEDSNFTAIAAWPSNLPKIGDVTASFDNPIDISPEGLQFSAVMAP